MVVDPILNNPNINKYIGIEEKAYDEFYDMIDDGTYTMDNLKDIFNYPISIDEKIIRGNDYLNKYFNRKNMRR